jgi:hypothetical protein
MFALAFFGSKERTVGFSLESTCPQPLSPGIFFSAVGSIKLVLVLLASRSKKYSY